MCTRSSSFEQRDTQIILELSDCPADARLSHMKRFCGPSETPALGGGDKVIEMSHIDRHSSLSLLLSI
jgi:hypothetical protein|tara:strand:- start:228 stop:431 length:204 start_codon:yes stop_codon:yes gene_type:complete